MGDKERLIGLNMIEGVGSVRTQALLEQFGSLDRVFKAKEKELVGIEKIGPKLAPKILQSIKDIDIGPELELVEKHGVKVITFLDKDYPENLKNIYDPPIVLYVKGGILPQDAVAVAVVGSRRASFYGMQTAEKMGFELASRGVTVISGLARGIDSKAHKGALKAKGRTLAVLGSGLANIYPEEHIKLAEEIAMSGAVISEFPMMTIPDKGNFPKRNRVISGLSLGVVVVEAAERSGALITADAAMEQGRDVFAIPGKVDSITSKGTNRLIKQGAKLAETVDDILEELNLFRCFDGQPIPSTQRDKGKLFPGLDKDENLVYTLLTSAPKHIDELVEESKLGISEISRILLNLEIRKLAKQLAGKNFVRS
ncbi:MAG: DNA-processing protein DprA [Candidatus Omnitrophica bacterium]|nr:DNA-processing protein DprA [Candidatus Omnitrophota bacterium]